MKLEEYIDGVRRTESSKNPLSDAVVALGLTNRMFHGIVGISTEMGEVVTAYKDEECIGVDFVNVAEEIGDAFWYTAVLFDELNITEMEVEGFTTLAMDCEVLPSDLVEMSADLLDKCKKTLFYGREYDTTVLAFMTLEFYQMLVNFIEGLKTKLDISKEKVWEINLNKLKIRYPEKFSLRDTEVRDLKTERIELERVSV